MNLLYDYGRANTSLFKRNKTRIQPEYSANKVGLFGSFALGENKAYSDIDVVVLLAEGAHNLHEKKAALRDFLEEVF